MKNLEDIVKAMLEENKSTVEGLLDREVEVEEARLLLKKYDAAIRPNFVNWMASASISVLNPKSQFAISSNLHDELIVNQEQSLVHPIMLLEFVRQAKAISDDKDTEYVYPKWGHFINSQEN